MSAFFFESPIQLAICGIAITAILAGGWIQTENRKLLYGAILSLLATIGFLVLERMVVTDREAITQLLYQAAIDVKQNDVNAVVRHIHSNRSDVAERIRSIMPYYEFTYVGIKTI